MNVFNYVKSAYVDDSKGLPCLLLGDVSQVIEMTTGIHYDWTQFVQDNTPIFVQDCTAKPWDIQDCTPKPYDIQDCTPKWWDVQDCTNPIVQKVKYIYVQKR